MAKHLTQPSAATNRDDQWLHRPDIWAGLMLGSALATRSFNPSLMPRTTAHQALVSGASGAIGFGVGNAMYGLGTHTGSTLGDLTLLGFLSAGGFVVSRVLPERDGEELWRPVARTVGAAMAAGGLSASVGVALRSQPHPRRGFAGAALVLAAGLTGARAVVHGVRAQRDAHDDYDPPPPQPVPAVARSVGIAVVLAALANGFRRSGRGLSTILERRFGVPEGASRWLGRGLSAGIWFGSGKILADTFVKGLRLYDRVVDPGFDRAPTNPTRSSGEGSPIPFARLGREGRRFVLNAPSAAEIDTVMGNPAGSAVEPIRVFVGYSAARTDEERVTLAIDELRRTGAFSRRLLVVGCPAGNGYVNTLPLEVLDYVLGGDTAAVAVQYGRLPSFLTLNRVTRGGRVQRRLLEAIAAELQTRPPDQRPKVVVYGESLGGWAGQDTFLHRGVAGLDELGVARALWVGTPYYSGWRHEVLGEGRATSDGRVIELSSARDLKDMPPDTFDQVRATLLRHGNDPVGYIEGGLLVRRPPWLPKQGPRPWGVPEQMSFLPGITAIQVIVDAVNATRPVPGVFRATGHEYTADLPDVVLAAYGIDRPELATWNRLIAHLQELDARRAAARKLPRASDQRPGPEMHAAEGCDAGVAEGPVLAAPIGHATAVEEP
jgi:uncharacterized membrane protein